MIFKLLTSFKIAFSSLLSAIVSIFFILNREKSAFNFLVVFIPALIVLYLAISGIYHIKDKIFPWSKSQSKEELILIINEQKKTIEDLTLTNQRLNASIDNIKSYYEDILTKLKDYIQELETLDKQVRNIKDDTKEKREEIRRRTQEKKSEDSLKMSSSDSTKSIDMEVINQISIVNIEAIHKTYEELFG